MGFLQIENDFLAIVAIVLMVMIPVAIIWFTMRLFRKKRERGAEKKGGFGNKFRSVKEERLKKSGKYPKK